MEAGKGGRTGGKEVGFKSIPSSLPLPTTVTTPSSSCIIAFNKLFSVFSLSSSLTSNPIIAAVITSTRSSSPLAILNKLISTLPFSSSPFISSPSIVFTKFIMSISLSEGQVVIARCNRFIATLVVVLVVAV